MLDPHDAYLRWCRFDEFLTQPWAAAEEGGEGRTVTVESKVESKNEVEGTDLVHISSVAPFLHNSLCS